MPSIDELLELGRAGRDAVISAARSYYLSRLPLLAAEYAAWLGRGLSLAGCRVELLDCSRELEALHAVMITDPLNPWNLAVVSPEVLEARMQLSRIRGFDVRAAAARLALLTGDDARAWAVVREGVAAALEELERRWACAVASALTRSVGVASRVAWSLAREPPGPVEGYDASAAVECALEVARWLRGCAEARCY